MRSVADRSWLQVVALAGLLTCRNPEAVCAICDRPIHPEMAATVVLEDGRQLNACCPRCALHHRTLQTTGIRRIEVTDHAGGGRLPLESAFLVDGSDQTPCLGHTPNVDPSGVALHTCYDRCVPSLIAFKDKSMARAFTTEHGGVLRLPSAVGP